MIKKIISGILIVIVIAYLIPLLLICLNMNKKTVDKVDYLIVLGAKVNDNIPTLALQYRLDAALLYLKSNSDTKVVVTGAKGSDEKYSEASVMKNYLLQKGINNNSILVDDKSFTTYQNLVNAKKLIDNDSKKENNKIAVVTTNFHILRSHLLCQRVFKNKCQMISSKNFNGLIGWYSLFREPLALYKSIILDN
ncbi:MAG: YdcF family protein [Bacilli bacterium]|jgi:uncharacterized SAM-binding protein YcdF (DUF218 family)|nr:YdcF family protein [Bacilli bacterium]